MYLNNWFSQWRKPKSRQSRYTSTSSQAKTTMPKSRLVSSLSSKATTTPSICRRVCLKPKSDLKNWNCLITGSSRGAPSFWWCTKRQSKIKKRWKLRRSRWNFWVHSRTDWRSWTCIVIRGTMLPWTKSMSKVRRSKTRTPFSKKTQPPPLPFSLTICNISQKSSWKT